MGQALPAGFLKDSFDDFVSQMGQADRVCQPLKDMWGSKIADDYQKAWIRLVNSAVELSQAIDRLSRAIPPDPGPPPEPPR